MLIFHILPARTRQLLYCGWLLITLLLILGAGCAPTMVQETGDQLEPAADLLTQAAPEFENVLEPVETDPPPLPTETPLLEEILQSKPLPDKLDMEGQIATSYAREDLAAKLDLDKTAVEVTAYEEIVWRDGSLGCPQPDMMYTQAMVDGYVIQLIVEGQVFTYHGAKGSDPFLCDTDEFGLDSQPPSLRRGELATPPGQE